MTQPKFDMDAALKALREGHDLTGKDGVLTPLIKQLTEAAMQAELEAHLADEQTPNRKNGATAKTVNEHRGSGSSGSGLAFQQPCHREGHPKLIPDQ